MAAQDLAQTVAEMQQTILALQEKVQSLLEWKETMESKEKRSSDKDQCLDLARGFIKENKPEGVDDEEHEFGDLSHPIFFSTCEYMRSLHRQITPLLDCASAAPIRETNRDLQ